MPTDESIIVSFRAADVNDLPPIGELSETRAQILWVLAVGQKLGMQTMSPAEISDVLRDGFGIPLSWQATKGILSKERGTVVRRKREGRYRFQIMQEGADEVAATASQGVLFIQPEQAFKGIRQTEAMLAELRGELGVCDPYVDPRTLDFLDKCQDAEAIHLLTVNVRNAAALKRDLTAFNRQHNGKLDIRVARDRDLHDRYIIHDDGLLLLGTSLNGLGGRQTFVVALGSDMRDDVLAGFEKRWAASTAL